MASQPPPPTTPALPAPGPDSPLHLVTPPLKVGKKSHHTTRKVEDAAPASSPPRQPIVDVGVARRAVKAGLVILEREFRRGVPDEKTLAFLAALKDLHLDAAGAEFDALLPARLQGRDLVGSSRVPESGEGS